MASYNSATIVGRLGRDPEMRYTASGDPVTSFSVAVDNPYGKKDDSGNRPTDWFKVTAWGKLAETCNQFLNKGREVLIAGRVGLDQWEAKDGAQRSQLSIRASEMRMLGGKKDAEGGMAPAAETYGGDLEPDDIPF